MISKFSFSNFYSFGETTEVSFNVSKKPSPSYFDVDLADGSRLNKVVSIVGANGSGKTQLLRPLAFLSWFVSKSFLHSDPKDDIAFRSHKLKEDEVSSFEIEFYINEVKYRYKLVSTLEKVIHESLYKKTSHLYSYIFTRDLDNESYAYKQKNFSFGKALADKIRGNVSLISAANVHDSSIARTISDYFEANLFNVSVTGRNEFHDGVLVEAASFFKENEEYFEPLNQILCDLDIGLSSIELKEVSAKNEKGEFEKLIIPFGNHKHNDEEFSLPFFEESSGTKSIFALLRNILPVLKNGGIAILDEMDNDLHLHMLIKIIDLFKFEYTNPKNAQLIFTCHTHEVLNYFKKHQVYLVERNQQYSESWRLDEVVGLRASDNVYAKYQAGALGAVPDL